MTLRKLAAALLLASGAVSAVGAPALAADPVGQRGPVTIQGYWKVFETYPNSAQGWRDCGNATVNVYKGHCKLDSETSAHVNLWGYVT